jgi:hypothetical protein
VDISPVTKNENFPPSCNRLFSTTQPARGGCAPGGVGAVCPQKGDSLKLLPFLVGWVGRMVLLEVARLLGARGLRCRPRCSRSRPRRRPSRTQGLARGVDLPGFRRPRPCRARQRLPAVDPDPLLPLLNHSRQVGYCLDLFRGELSRVSVGFKFLAIAEENSEGSVMGREGFAVVSADLHRGTLPGTSGVGNAGKGQRGGRERP